MNTKTNTSKLIKFVSKRSTQGALGSLAALSLIVTLYNSVSFPEVIQEVKNLQQLVLNTEVLSKDPNIVYHKDEILNDYENRISDEFHVPEGLKSRVGFWFDIYTRYDSNKKVVHYSTYPWIIFDVIDISDIINSDTPKIRWMRNAKAEKFVDGELQNFREALNHLAKGKELDEENQYQVKISKALEVLPGNLKEKASAALKSIRIQTGQKNFFGKGLEISPLYLSGMEDVFRKYKLPTELTRIPFVESSFNHRAVSKVGASGIWQFMDYTGKSFLTVNEHIDERNSPFKATIAAAKLLKENHMILKRSWPLAITAWNHGPGGIRKAMKAAGSDDITEIINNYQSRTFDFASSNFYCEFLAALYAEKYHDQIFKDLNYEKTLDLHTVKLAKSISAKELLRRSGLAKEDFILYNPDLRKALDRNISIPSGFSLMLDTPARVTLRSLLTKDTRPSEKEIKVGQNEIPFHESSASRN